MALYAEGDGAAFRRLFELMAPRIRAFFLRSFSDAAVADKLTQATFLKLHSARVTYRADRPLKPWVFTIAAGIRCDGLRRRYRLPRHIGDADLERSGSGADGRGAGRGSGERNHARRSRARGDRAMPESRRPSFTCTDTKS